LTTAQGCPRFKGTDGSQSKEWEMENHQINTGHGKRLASLVREDGTECWDLERISLFYIIAGNEDLYRRRNAIYDFNERCIKTHLRDGSEDFPSGQRSLIKLGFNLFNGYREDCMTPMDLFWNLNNRNTRIAHDAIGLRFSTLGAAILETYV